MPDPVISRRLVAWGSIIVMTLSLVFFGSLISWMTGIYRCPAVTILDGSTGYLVRHHGRWFSVSINGSGGPDVQAIDTTQMSVTPGTWAVKVKMSDGWEFPAMATFNLVDVYQISLGKYRHLLPSE